MSKVLVAYFSASGTTARAAREAAAAVGGELHEIRPAEPYTTADLDWRNKRSRSSVEMNDPACRPELAEPAPDASGCDAVLLGFPIWWYVEPRVVDSFVEAANLAGVRVTPFATSGGSGIDGAERSLAEKYPDVAWQPGALLNGRDVATWARGLGL